MIGEEGAHDQEGIFTRVGRIDRLRDGAGRKSTSVYYKIDPWYGRVLDDSQRSRISDMNILYSYRKSSQVLGLMISFSSWEAHDWF